MTASIDWLVRRLNPLLHSQARYHLRGLPDVTQTSEDLVQETWVTSLLRLADLQPKEGRMTPVLRAFLAKTMRYTALNWLRSRGNRTRSTSPAGGDPLATLAASTLDVIKSVARHEHDDIVTRALQQVDEQDREILVLRGMEEHSYEDLSVILESDAGALRMRYLRAKTRLRALLPDSLVEDLADG